MLDFYLIETNAPEPNYPNEKKHIGSVCLEELELLNATLISHGLTTINFYEDRKLDSLFIQKASSVLQIQNFSKVHEEKTKQKFLSFFLKAIEKEEDIYLFSD